MLNVIYCHPTSVVNVTKDFVNTIKQKEHQDALIAEMRSFNVIPGKFAQLMNSHLLLMYQKVPIA